MKMPGEYVRLFFNFKEHIFIMGRQIDTETTETIDNIIFYKRNGKFLMRTVQKQAKTSQKAAKDYGRASNKAKVLRQLLESLLPNPRDRDMQNRLTPAMRQFTALLTARKVIQSMENPLAGFRFILSSDLKDCLRFSITISQQHDGDVVIEIPVINPFQSIAAPAGTSNVQLELRVVGFNLNDAQTFEGSSQSISMSYVDAMQPAVNQILEISAPTGTIIVVAAALSYWNNEGQIRQVGFMPVELAAAFIRS